LEFTLYPSQGGDGAIWTETQSNVPLADGYFHVLMGSFNPLTATHFADSERYLQVSVDAGDGAIDLPRQRIASVPYALQAASAPWSGLSDVPPGFADGIDGVEYDNVIIVAKSGGDFTTIQAAVDSIVGAGYDNYYLIWVGPGWYNEQVILKPYIHLVGAGRSITTIENSSGSLNDPPDTATLTLSSGTAVRRLSVLASGTTDNNAAILVPDGWYNTVLSDVYAEARGAGTVNYGIVITGSNIFLTFDYVHIGAKNGTESNTGLLNEGGANVTLNGGFFWARGGGVDSVAIANRGSDTRLQTYGITANANGATVLNMALWNTENARATLNSGSFNGRDGSGVACGICNEKGGGVSAIDVGASGNSDTGTGYGLLNDGGMANLQGGSFHAGGNAAAIAISNNSDEIAFAPSLRAHEVWASVGGADTCIAMLNEAGGSAMLVGGEFWAAVCKYNYGISNTGSGSKLEISNVLVNSSGGADNFFGLTAGANTTTRISNSELRGNDYALSIDGGYGRLQFVFLNGDLEGDASNLGCNAVTQHGTFYANSCPPEVP
jgi:hypothetical protein